jgi:hypothetical protein
MNEAESIIDGQTAGSKQTMGNRWRGGTRDIIDIVLGRHHLLRDWYDHECQDFWFVALRDGGCDASRVSDLQSADAKNCWRASNKMAQYEPLCAARLDRNDDRFGRRFVGFLATVPAGALGKVAVELVE